MRRVLITAFASLLGLALIAPTAQGATEVRHVRVDMPASPQTTPPTPAGMLTLDFVFKNSRGNKKKFTPRQLTRIEFSKVPLLCFNSPVNPTGSSQLLLTTTLATKIKLKKKAPPPNPKPGRYAFNFSYSFPAFTGNFPAFTGTLTGTIDKPNGAAKPRSPRSQGTLIIEDLDSPPDQWNCSTEGRRSWGGLPLTAT